MKTTKKKVQELIETNECPLPIGIIPDKMGINLVAVDSIEWTKLDDEQLIDLKINFIPDVDENLAKLRLEKEADELQDKLYKLKIFIGTPACAGISYTQRMLLNVQEKAMESYLRCLEYRIINW